MNRKDSIIVIGARERNLKNITVTIPKNKITVFTGVSGSGKSSIVFDIIAAESQRQLNETYTTFIRQRLPQYRQPNVDRIENLPVSFVINQKRLGGNIRSTVGTITDIYSLLRLLYSRIGNPFVGYAEDFSFNNIAGMCERCDGIGFIDTIDLDRLLDRNKSLNEGAILFPTFEVGGWRLRRYIHSGLFDNDKKLKNYTTGEMQLLLYKDNYKLPNPDAEWPKTSLYEGVIPRIERSFLKGESKEHTYNKKRIEYIVNHQPCPSCGGSRLNKTIRSCMIEDKSIADCTSMQIDELLLFIKSLHSDIAESVLTAIIQQLEQMVSIGLGYLSLNRGTSTLSGGESQRIKMVKQLGSSLCDVLYIFDEPSIGLHPYNVEQLNHLFFLLRDKGNTVLIVEHDPDVIKIAEHVIDMGPGAGIRGGQIVFQGSYKELTRADTVTAHYLQHNDQVDFKTQYRSPKGYYSIKNAKLHNLHDITIDIPKGLLTIVTGVAGSGKSSLINGAFVTHYTESIIIDQKGVATTKRSNIATFTGMFDYIRKQFAVSNGVDFSLFSFNSKGACPVCKGLGAIYTDLAFMDIVITKCDACEGHRYKPEILQYTISGYNISEILDLTIDEASNFFKNSEISNLLERLKEVGVGYLSIGQSLDTLSGGELQRIKLATELGNQGNVYILDEPTTGLHMADTQQLLNVFNKLVDHGNTVIIIEHNIDVIVAADWIIDMGPGAGQNGGQIVFSGRPHELLACTHSITGQYLKKHLNKGV